MNLQTKWLIDHKQSNISFKIRHLLISNIKGVFNSFGARIYTNGNDFSTAEINFWMDVASMSTGNENRDDLLKNSSFLDMANHKQIIFNSLAMGKPDASGNHELSGMLTMKGVTKNISLNVHLGGIAKDTRGVERAGFKISGKIDRNEWGLYWNKAIETGGLILKEEIMISGEIELTHVQQQECAITMAAGYAQQNVENSYAYKSFNSSSRSR